MEARHSPIPLERSGPLRQGAGNADAPARIQVWLAAIGERLRATLDDFPDAIWLGTPSGTFTAERDDQGRWTTCAGPAAAPGDLLGPAAGRSVVHEVPDVAFDAVFDDYPTAARWPMARRLCRIPLQDDRAPHRRSVMMLVGSLPGRLSDVHHRALEDWIPSATALLTMMLDTGDLR